jgi:glyoxylase I family protein
MQTPATASKPTRLNHVAYHVLDLEATHDFYTNVLGMDLLGALETEGGGRSTTGEAMPRFLHFFYGMQSGEAIAFFALPTSFDKTGDGLPVWTRHLALSVESDKELAMWRQRLSDHGVAVSDVVNHDDIWHSIYFSDPNDIRLELTYQLRPLTTDEAMEGEDAIQKWIADLTVAPGAGD